MYCWSSNKIMYNTILIFLMLMLCVAVVSFRECSALFGDDTCPEYCRELVVLLPYLIYLLDLTLLHESLRVMMVDPAIQHGIAVVQDANKNRLQLYYFNFVITIGL
ncbi:hypothetical protein DICVIV_13609 [Dictyocaulus viviparus]|uniref:Uncharacterized protein n=1 Tax=Dictyocaulus viviparus TaxID=29172 RepID=A0A0D8XDD5_DICVI|nr:hypothetical protein DICVIV_13609 [Dictyocaulus viviparus]